MEPFWKRFVKRAICREGEKKPKYSSLTFKIAYKDRLESPMVDQAIKAYNDNKDKNKK